MKKLIIILTLTISTNLLIAQTKQTLSDADIKKEWIETIDWIKSKSSYYNIYHGGRFDQKFKIYTNNNFYLVDKSRTRSKRPIYKMDTRGTVTYETLGYFTDQFKGSLEDLTHYEIFINDDKYGVKRLSIGLDCKRSMGEDMSPEKWQSENRIVLYVRDDDDMPQRLANAFNSLGKISSRYRKIINEEKRKKESDRIKSYGEKF